jgi:hypothetical protein
MRRPIAVAAAAGALAVGGTAIAAPGDGPLGGLFRGDEKDRQAEFARDLASKLDGVSAAQVQKALGEVRRERQTEARTDLAKALAAKLDVSTDDVEKALQKGEDQARRSFQRGERPRATFVETLAKELDKSESDVRKAFRAIQRDHINRELDEAVKEGRLTEKQADRIRRRAEQGPPGFGRRFHGGPRGFHGGPRGFHGGPPGIVGPGFVGPAPAGPPPGGPGFELPPPAP